jgi:hypothetical protein
MTSRFVSVILTVCYGVPACTQTFQFDVANVDAGTTTQSADAGLHDADGADAQGSCVADCAALGAKCAAEWLTCVECNADGDCTNPGYSRCDVVLHRCVACGSNVDCLSNER